jgi:outer membrane protein assembly factor BamB
VSQRRRVTKRILIAAVLIALAAGGTAFALWYREQTEEKVVRGSSTVEFVTTAEPAEETRPKRVVEEIPWPMYAFDRARTHAPADFRHRPPFRQLWMVETDDYIEFPPAVAQGRVFVANQHGDFLAIGAKRGRILWRKDFDSCIASGPAVADGVVYQTVMNPNPCARDNRASQPGFVIAMDTKTGRVKWRFDTGVVESSPLVVGNLLYVGSWNHRIYALDIRTGKVRWEYDTGEEINSSAAYAEGTIYIGANEGHLYALNAWTGALKWRASSFTRFGRREYFYPTPTVAYGRVYIGNADGTLYAFGARSGDLLWARPAGTYIYTAAAVSRNRVYVGTYDGRFSAFDAATGDPVWSWEAPGAIHGAPTVMAGLVYFSTTSAGLATSRAQRFIKAGRRGTYALDARTGRPVWRRPGVGQYSPIVADAERVYLTGSTRVYGLMPKRRR